MNLHNIARATDTIGMFMGETGKPREMLCALIIKAGCSGFSYQMHDGSYWSVRFDVDEIQRLLKEKSNK